MFLIEVITVFCYYLLHTFSHRFVAYTERPLCDSLGLPAGSHATHDESCQNNNRAMLVSKLAVISFKEKPSIGIKLVYEK